MEMVKRYAFMDIQKLTDKKLYEQETIMLPSGNTYHHINNG